MPIRVHCPDNNTLAQFTSGELSDGEAEPIGDHLESCPACTKTLGQLPADDTLVSSIVHAHRSYVIDPEDREAVARLIARLYVLPRHTNPAIGIQNAHDTTHNSNSPSRVDPIDPMQQEIESQIELAQVVKELLSPSESSEDLGRLGTYRVKSVLGSGGMGIVFEAEDTQLGRMVALKVMQPRLLHKVSNRRRFLREARSVAAIEHDHIVPIYHVGEERGVPYFVMPLMRGESLESHLRRESRLPMDDIVQIGSQIALGLAAAHAHGLVHRDIKPANVWLEEKNQASAAESPSRIRVKILDFGLVLDGREDSHLTQSGVIAGTPAFMSPEQALGETTDFRSDLFSLGCVLYYACSGKLPFNGRSSVAVMLEVINNQPVLLRDLNASVPAKLESLVSQLLQKNPTDRIQTAFRVVEALRTVEFEGERWPSAKVETTTISDEATNARPISVFSQRSVMRSIVLSCIVAAVAWLIWNELLRDKTPRSSVEANRERMPLLMPNNHASRPSVRRETNPAIALSGLVPHPSAIPGYRQWQMETRVPRGELFALAWDPTGQRIVCGSSNGYVRMLDAESSDLLHIMPAHIGSVWSVDWSRDGDHLVTGGEDGTVRLYDSDGKLLRDLGRHLGLVRTVAFSPDGLWVASAGWDSVVRLWKTAGELGPVFEGHSEQIDSVAWHPSGTKLASASWDGIVRLWNLDGSPSPLLKGLSGAVLGLAWSPDGKRLASAALNGMIRLNNEDGEEVASWNGLSSTATAIAWSVDDVLATGFQDGKVRLWGRNAELLKAEDFGPGRINALTWTDDGRRLAIIADDDAIRFVNQTGEPDGRISMATDVIRSIAWNIEGKLASAGDDSTVRIWNEDGTQSELVRGHTNKTYSVAWHRTGNRLVSAGGDMAVRVWDLTRHSVDILNGHHPVSWNPIGDEIAWGFGKEVQLGAPGAAPHSLYGHKSGVYGIAWNSDGTQLASSDANGEIRLWNRDGSTDQIWQAEPMVTSLGWHPKQPIIATGSSTGNIQLWDLNGHLRSSWKGHIKGVAALAWSSDGERLITSSYDQSVRLWNIAGLPVGTLTSGMAIGTAISCDATGQRIATSHTDGTIHIWDSQSLEPQWIVQLFNDGNWVRFDSSGRPMSSDPSIVDSRLVVIAEDEFGMLHNEKPSEFLQRISP